MTRFALYPISATLALTIILGAGAHAGSPVFTVAKIGVNVEARDAVTAKEKAIRAGSMRAFRALLSRLVAFAAHNRLPELSHDAVDGMLDGFVVREERFSSTRYIAKLDFTFEADKVRDLLNRIGLPHTDQQSAPVSLVLVAEEEVGEQEWRAAWKALDLEHGLAPLRLISKQQTRKLMAGADQTEPTVADLHTRLGEPRLVVASAQIYREAQRLKVAVRGTDAVGPLAFSQSFRIYSGDTASAASRAARISRLVLQARWRLVSLKAQGALDGPAPLESFKLTAAFDSLKAWQEMRAEIAGISGVQDFSVKSLFAGGAEVVLSFPGGPERFAKAASARGMALNESRGEWILQRR